MHKLPSVTAASGTAAALHLARPGNAHVDQAAEGKVDGVAAEVGQCRGLPQPQCLVLLVHACEHDDETQ
eukprot:2155-Heterococcus_DN1.PRE.2